MYIFFFNKKVNVFFSGDTDYQFGKLRDPKHCWYYQKV